MSRDGSLDLLTEAKENIDLLKTSQDIKPVKVKSILEHLRSALEYLANDTFDKYHPNFKGKRPKIYFPFGSQSFVDNFFSERLRLKPVSSSPLYALFNSIQSYQTNENWLDIMCSLTNEAKHRNPIPFEKEEIITGKTISALGYNLFKVDDKSKITVKNLTISGIKVSDFELDKGVLKSEENGMPINFTLTKENKIKFHGNEYEVIPFLEECHGKLHKFINDSYNVLDALP